jgi:nicotinate-nucleotide adenylyltransferase
VRLGLFGGTFDPPHVGHLLAASDAFEALQLDRLVFVPNAVQPLKAGRTGGAIAPAPDRLEMVRRLCHGDARFLCDSIEVDRGGLSFTVETLRAYRSRFPEAALILLIGEDVVDSLPSWRESAAVLELAELVVLTRGAAPATGPGRRVPTRRIDVSSTEIRARARAGLSLTGFMPDQVAAYITERGLYR